MTGERRPLDKKLGEVRPERWRVTRPLAGGEGGGRRSTGVPCASVAENCDEGERAGSESAGDSGGVTLPILWYGGIGEVLTRVATVAGEETDMAAEPFLASSNSCGLDGRTSAMVKTPVKLSSLGVVCCAVEARVADAYGNEARFLFILAILTVDPLLELEALLSLRSNTKSLGCDPGISSVALKSAKRSFRDSRMDFLRSLLSFGLGMGPVFLASVLWPSGVLGLLMTSPTGCTGLASRCLPFSLRLSLERLLSGGTARALPTDDCSAD